MKNTLLILSLLFALTNTAYSCPEISGEYSCQNEQLDYDTIKIFQDYSNKQLFDLEMIYSDGSERAVIVADGNRRILSGKFISIAECNEENTELQIYMKNIQYNLEVIFKFNKITGHEIIVSETMGGITNSARCSLILEI